MSMISRREVLLGTAAVTAAAMLPPVPANAKASTNITGWWWEMWTEKIDAIPASELSGHYQMMTRNCSPAQIALIEQPGPLVSLESRRWHYRCCQYVYRRMAHLAQRTV